jgi:hypothetical protein
VGIRDPLEITFKNHVYVPSNKESILEVGAGVFLYKHWLFLPFGKAGLSRRLVSKKYQENAYRDTETVLGSDLPVLPKIEPVSAIQSSCSIKKKKPK